MLPVRTSSGRPRNARSRCNPATQSSRKPTWRGSHSGLLSHCGSITTRPMAFSKRIASASGAWSRTRRSRLNQTSAAAAVTSTARHGTASGRANGRVDERACRWSPRCLVVGFGSVCARWLQAGRPALQHRTPAQEQQVAPLHDPGHTRQAADQGQPAPAGQRGP